MRHMHLNAFCPTIPTATLATQSTNTRNSTHTPLSSLSEWDVYPSMSLPATGFASDFQSNGHEGRSPGAHTPVLTGLGIRYIEQHGSALQSDSILKQFPSSFSTTTKDHYNACGEYQNFATSHCKPTNDAHICVRPTLAAEDIYPDDCDPIYPTSNIGAWSSLSAVCSDGAVDDGFLSSVIETASREYSTYNHDLFNPPMPVTPPMVGPFVDINMFMQPFSAQEPSACVNPADTVSVGFYMQDSQEEDDLDSPCPPSSSTSSDGSSSLDATMDSSVSVLTAAVVGEDIQEPRMSVPAQVVRVPDDNVLKTEHSEYFVNFDDLRAPPEVVQYISSPVVSTPTSSPFPSPHRQTTLRRPKTATRSYVRKVSVKPEDVRRSVETLPWTPVLDAHRGIELMELIAKAERYRLRNPGQDLNKKWLASFAGKLTTAGELIDDFRCYVVDCPQTNKRRDHILIHVGSHVDQRPFPCSFCSMRFLRKNEWKRHEASHTGEKPFICSMCQFEQRAFVRRDLLSQHMKRTHGISLTADKENGQRSRKKAKLEY